MCENVRNKVSVATDGFAISCTRWIEYNVRASSSQSVRLLKAEPKDGTGIPLPLHVNRMEPEWGGVRRSPRSIVRARLFAGFFKSRLLSRRLTSRVKRQLSFTLHRPLQCRLLSRRLTCRIKCRLSFTGHSKAWLLCLRLILLDATGKLALSVHRSLRDGVQLEVLSEGLSQSIHFRDGTLMLNALRSSASRCKPESDRT